MASKLIGSSVAGARALSNAFKRRDEARVFPRVQGVSADLPIRTDFPCLLRPQSGNQGSHAPMKNVVKLAL